MFWIRHERSEFKHKTYRLSVFSGEATGWHSTRQRQQTGAKTGGGHDLCSQAAMTDEQSDQNDSNKAQVSSLP